MVSEKEREPKRIFTFRTTFCHRRGRYLPMEIKNEENNKLKLTHENCNEEENETFGRWSIGKREMEIAKQAGIIDENELKIIREGRL